MPKSNDPYATISQPLQQPTGGTADPYARVVEGEVLPPEPPKTPVLQKALQDAGDVGIGAGRGVANTAGGIGGLEYALMPKGVKNSGYGKDFSEGLDTLKDWSNPKNIWQSVGKGAEQVGESFLPGGAEEDAARGLMKFLPEAEKSAPLAKVFTGAVSSGLVNKAQGGSFGVGAATGAATGALGEGLRAVAPHVAESALNIRKLDRAYGRAPGRAILDETKGLRPSRIAVSAQRRLDVLNPELEAAADRASTRPAPRIAGFLQPPKETMELAHWPAEEPSSSPMAFNAKPDTESPIGNYRFHYGGSGPVYTSGGAHPELSGRLEMPQGTMTRTPEMSNSIPRAFEENRSASLRPGLDELRKAFSTAERQGERTTMGQLTPMMTHLTENVHGNPITPNVTPRQLLDLKRGFGNEYIHRWNPDTMEGVKGTAARTYHQLAHAFEDAVPEAAPLNRRISSLIPIAKRAESAERNASTTQRVLHRISAHTGAGLGAAAGGAAGYRKGGLGGAIGGATAGMLMPEAVMSPIGQMVIARGFNSGAPMRIARGAALQLDRTGKRAKAQ